MFSFTQPLIEFHNQTQFDLPEESEVIFEQNFVETHHNDQSLGIGKLLFTESEIYFLNPQNSFKIPDVRKMIFHAIQPDPRPCIYCQLDSGEDEMEVSFSDFAEMNLNEENNQEDEEKEEEKGHEIAQTSTTVDLRFFPQNPELIQGIYDAFCDAAVRNPDPEDSEDEEDSDFHFDREEVERGVSSIDLSEE